MRIGDLYEFHSGLVMRVERATGPFISSTLTRRLVFEHGGRTASLYWQHQATFGTLLVGASDHTANREALAGFPLPLAPFENEPRLSAGDVAEYDQIGGQRQTGLGRLEIRVEYEDANLAKPNWYSTESIFGTIYRDELRGIGWKFDFLGLEGDYIREFWMNMERDRGPVSVWYAGQLHNVVRAVVDGVVYE